MAVKTFALPDLGEGLTESELVSWRVELGDTVELNQIIAEVETAKALVELPSPFAGIVHEFFAEPGATVAVGAPIVAFDVTDAAGAEAADAEPADAEPTGEAPSDDTRAAPAAAKVEREPMLVGYGPPVEGGARPKRRARAAVREEVAQRPDTVPEEVAQRPSRRAVPPTEPRLDEAALRPRSTPPVRARARELGIDLTDLAGTGEHGLITRDDVESHAAATTTDTAASQERETRIPIQGVRKHTAAAMVASAFTAPHATEFLTIDVTPAVELLERVKASRAFAGQRVTMLTILAKALCIAVARTPSVNSRWDEDAQQIVQFGYVNLGIAAATPRGLMVPNIKDADRLDLASLASALTALVESAKAGRSGPEELRGGTISITNIGVFGIDAGTPILNPGEAAILAMGAVRRMPWEYRDDIALRQVMTLSLSFDHRLVDGEQASRFLADVGAILADPGIVLTMV